ncbi:MAG TPA: hypothetical protein VF159_01920 [Gemmatimonadaceae bacterium]
MATKLTVAGKASLPLEDGGTVAPIDLALDLTYTSDAYFIRDYAGAVADEAIDFGTLAVPGAKAIIVKCLTGACTIKFNGDATAWPLAPGGWMAWSNPSTPFPTAAAITTTGAARVLFLAVG